MGKNGLKWEFGLVFYKFAENREFLIGRFLPYKQGIETPDSRRTKSGPRLFKIAQDGPSCPKLAQNILMAVMAAYIWHSIPITPFKFGQDHIFQQKRKLMLSRNSLMMNVRLRR